MVNRGNPNNLRNKLRDYQYQNRPYRYRWDFIKIIDFLYEINTLISKKFAKKLLSGGNANFIDIVYANNPTSIIQAAMLRRDTLQADESIPLLTDEEMNVKTILIHAGYIQNDSDPKVALEGVDAFNSLSPNQFVEFNRRFRLHFILTKIREGDTIYSEVDGNPMDLNAIKKEAYLLVPEASNPPSWWPVNADVQNKWVPFAKPNFYETYSEGDNESFDPLKEIVDRDFPYTPTTTTLETTTLEDPSTQSGGRKKKTSLKKHKGKKNASLKKHKGKKNASLKKQSKKHVRKSRRAQG